MLEQLRKAPKYRIEKSFSGLSGGCSGDLHSTPEHQVAMVYSPDGEIIASYSSDGGWQSLTTKAENQFLLDSNAIYKQVYDATRAEINAGVQKSVMDYEETSTIDVRV